MEDKLKNLPLRAVPNDYAEHVIRHIAQVEARRANAWIGAQIAVTGLLALLIAWVQSAEIFSVLDAVIENLNSALFALDQFSGDLANALSNFRIEPLESIASAEWLMLAIAVGSVWLLANGWLIVNLKKEKLA